MKRYLVLMMIMLIMLSLTNLAISGSDASTNSGNADKGQEIAAGTCAGCHNTDGNSIIPINPNLAGQHESYIFKQLVDFKDEDDGKPAKRVSAVMAPMVEPLSIEDMKDVAAYYAQQTPVAATSKNENEELLELGKIIYHGGSIENEVPACSSCHAPNGVGIPPNYPRVAGQHAEYTYAQLNAFSKHSRKNDNKVMQKVVTRMSVREKRAVSEFIANIAAD